MLSNNRFYWFMPLVALFFAALLSLASTEATAAQPPFDCTVVVEIDVVECDALVAIYNNTGGDNWFVNTNWLQTNTPCDWYAITCTSGHVTKIDFWENSIVGQLPAEIGNLTHLMYLRIYENAITSVPAEIENLTNLTYLSLMENSLSSVPVEIWTLTNLTSLYLSASSLNIPAEIGNLTNLTSLHLWSDQLSSVPVEIWTLTNLTSLGLSGQLTSLPAEINNLTDLTFLSLQNNELSNLPAEIWTLTNLTFLYLAGNQLSSISTEVGNLTNLTRLSLSGNQLSSIPAEIGNLTNLTRLDLDNNVLSSIPAEIGDLNALEILDIMNNVNLSGSLPYNFSNLVNLSMFLYQNTGLCEPSNLTSWLANISHRQGTGIACDLLSIYLLAFDNDVNSPANLTARYGETLQGIVAATATVEAMDKKAVVLADLSGDGNTHILTIENGVVMTETGLINVNGVLDSTLTEYDMADGQQLGQFLKWALTHHGATKNIVSYVGHGMYLAPDVDLSGFSSGARSAANSLFPLAYHIGAHPDYTDSTPESSLITPYDLQQMLEIGTNGGTNPIDVLNLIHCFSATVEELYELANDGGTPYATMITASPNYTFFDGPMLGDALSLVDAGDTAEDMSADILTAYDDAIAQHDLVDGNADVEHPRHLIAVESALLPPIKTAMDELSTVLLQEFSTDATVAYQDLAAAHAATTQFYDTTYCAPQDWNMTTEDALVDVASFMSQIETTFGESVETKAQLVRVAANAAVIHTVSHDGTPWIAAPLTPTWQFNGSGLALFADLQGIVNGNERTLSWVSRFYTDTTTIDNTDDNPHPYLFVQGTDTWADVFLAFWQAAPSGLTLETEACLPSLPPVAEVIALEAEGGMGSINVSWQIANPLNGALDTYRIYRSQPSVTPLQLIATQIGATYIDSEATLSVGETYCYYVDAVDAAGNIIGTSNTSCTVFGELSLVIPDRNVAPTATGVAIPISAINADGLCIGAMSIKITYDPSIVVATGVANTAFTSNYQFMANIAQLGVVNISSIINICQELTGGGALFEVLFDVVGAVGDVSTLDFIHGVSSTEINHQTDPLDVTTAQPVTTHLLNGSATVETAFVQGDVSGGGSVTSLDALLASGIALNPQGATPQQLSACDVNGDGACNSADVTLILCYDVYDNWQTCGLRRSQARYAASPVSIEVGSVSDVDQGQPVQIPVSITNSQQIAGGILTLTYDPAIVTVSGITATNTLLQGRVWAIDSSISGVLRIAFADTVELGDGGTLFYIEALMPAESADIRIAGTELNVISGLDWETNLGNEIAIVDNSPTFDMVHFWIFLPYTSNGQFSRHFGGFPPSIQR